MKIRLGMLYSIREHDAVKEGDSMHVIRCWLCRWFAFGGHDSYQPRLTWDGMTNGNPSL